MLVTDENLVFKLMSLPADQLKDLLELVEVRGNTETEPPVRAIPEAHAGRPAEPADT